MSKRRKPGRSKPPQKKKRSGARPGRWALLLVCVGLGAVLVWQINQDPPFERVPPLHQAARQLQQAWRERFLAHRSPPSAPEPRNPPRSQPRPPARAVPAPPAPKPAPHTLPPREATPVLPQVAPVSAPPDGPRVGSLLEAQIVLMRQAISPGAIDGAIGSQTRAALRAFQQREGLPATGALDVATRARLRIEQPLFVDYQVTPADLARLEPLSRTWLGKSGQSALEFETVLELVAEHSKCRPSLVRSLNPSVDWTQVSAGTRLRLPNTARPQVNLPAALVRIRLSERTLQAYDSHSNLLAHFPCSIGRVASKRPTGELSVKVRIPHPNYTFNPAIFPESAEGRELGRKLVLPPGPNNPVGLAWIGLDKPGYGIHGTPIPENVGRTESHGCFRLANWDAEYLLELVSVGLPVVVLD